MGGVKGAGDLTLVDLVEAAGAEEVFDGTLAGMGLGGEFGEDLADGVYDLGAGTVVEGEGEGGAGVFGGGFGGPLHGFLDFGGEFGGATDVGHADVVGVHALDVADEVALEELHEEGDFGLGPTQVILDGEGVEGDPRKVDAGGGFYDELNGLGTFLVAKEALEGPFSGPAAIAVHDDGDVLGNSVGVKLAIDELLLGGELMYAARSECAQNNLANIDASTPRWGMQWK